MGTLDGRTGGTPGGDSRTGRLGGFALTAAMLLCLTAGGALFANATYGRLFSTTTAESADPVRPRYVTKAIEDIHQGDLVLARDQHGVEIGYRPVEEVYRRTSYHLRHLTFRSHDGEPQQLSTTDEHPFWSVSAGAFVDAGELRVGDEVTGPDGQAQFLADTHRTEHPEGMPVYNFRVAEYHTYFAQSPDGRGPPVLVHNANCGAWEVGRADDLRLRSRGDQLDIHHAVQSHPALQIIRGYDPRTGPAIAVPNGLHRMIPTIRGPYNGTARQLLARDIINLKKASAPNSSLRRLINLNKTLYPGDF